MIDREGWVNALRVELEESIGARLRPNVPGRRSSEELVEVEKIEVVGTFPALRARIFFRDRRRPDCFLGYEWAEEEIFQDPEFEDYPQGVAHIIIANFAERIEAADSPGLPADCDPQDVIWILN